MRYFKRLAGLAIEPVGNGIAGRNVTGERFCHECFSNLSQLGFIAIGSLDGHVEGFSELLVAFWAATWIATLSLFKRHLVLYCLSH